MCDRIAIVNKGNLVALDTTERLLERINSKKIRFKVKNTNQFKKIKLDGVKFSMNDVFPNPLTFPVWKANIIKALNFEVSSLSHKTCQMG